MSSRPKKKKQQRDPSGWKRTKLFNQLCKDDVDEIFMFDELDVVVLKCDCGCSCKHGELAAYCIKQGHHFTLCDSCAKKKKIDLQDLFLSKRIEEKSW